MGHDKCRLVAEILSNALVYMKKRSKVSQSQQPTSSFSCSPAAVAETKPLPDKRDSCFTIRDVVLSPSFSHATSKSSCRTRTRFFCSSVSTCNKQLKEYSSLDHDNGRGTGTDTFIPDTFDAMLSWSTSGRHRPTDTEKSNPKSPPVVVREDEVAISSPRIQVKPGVKVRKNSVRVQAAAAAARRSQSGKEKKSLWAESYAVVKLSGDPRKEFMESMMEMIVENKMKCKNDLEELLACYLSLNSGEYHDLIVNVFQQIWFDLLP